MPQVTVISTPQWRRIQWRRGGGSRARQSALAAAALLWLPSDCLHRAQLVEWKGLVDSLHILSTIAIPVLVFLYLARIHLADLHSSVGSFGPAYMQ